MNQVYRNMNLELISFKICPFVQRAVITLLHLEIPYSITYIDLGSPPEWFTQLSPFGKVPVLKIDQQDVIFESAIINEFLNDTHGGKLMPSDPIQRAIDRSWIEFGSSLTLDFSNLIHSQDAEAFESQLQLVSREMAWLENRLGQGPYFNGDDFSLVDIAYAPLFMRTDFLQLADSLYPQDRFPKLTAWAAKLLSIPELAKSTAPGFFDIFKGHLSNKAPYVANRLNLL